MTPTELDLLHLRLQQIAEVLAAIVNGVAPTDNALWKNIAAISQGMDRGIS